MPKSSRLPLHAMAVAAFFLALAIVFTFPIGAFPGSRALDLGPDTRLFLWTLGWDTHALASHPLAIFDANIFYPEPRTLAYSEHQIGSAFVAAPVILATGNLVLGLNVVLLLSCAASGALTYCLARELGTSRTGALVAGVVFALTPPRFFRLGQLHLATVQWMPATLALIHKYAGGGRRRHLLGASGLFTLQALSGGQSGLFLALACTSLVLYLAVFGELRPRGSVARDGLAAALLALCLNVPFVLPYLEVQRELGLERQLSEAAFWSPSPESFVASPAHAHRLLLRALGWERPVLREAKAYLFPGLLPLLLALAALVAKDPAPAARAKRAPRPPPPRALRGLDAAIVVAALIALAVEASGGLRFALGPMRISAGGGGRAALSALGLAALRLAWFRGAPFAFVGALERARDRFRSWAEARMGLEGAFYLLLALVALWASLGPAAGLYGALYRLVPGFDFVRVPSRLTLLSVLGLAVLAGIGADRLKRRFSAAAPLAIVLLLVELAAFPLDARPYPLERSPLDEWLAAEGEPGPIAVFPVPDPRDTLDAARRHSAYMLYATVHFRPMVNGYSGFTPPGHDRLFRTLASFPSVEGIDALEALGVRYAVLHRDGYSDARWEETVRKLEELEGRLELVADLEAGRVYELTPVSGPGRPDRGS